MSLGPNYNPVPPRVWSRVQTVCDDSSPQAQQMLLKGNILQYKKNSSSLTKSQRYSKIAKGQWTNRNKSFATKTQTYTNPNTSSLQRVNYIEIPFPNNIVGSPNNISGPFQTNVPNPFNCPTTTLQDGGSLVGNVQVLKCDNGIITKITHNNPYNSTTCSDVPGTPEVLYWDSTVETWYPRTRYVMPTSGNKWPEGYKGLVSAVTPNPPTELSIDLHESNCPLVTWSYDNCPPVTSFNVYLDDDFYKTVTVPYVIFTDLEIGQEYEVTVTSIVADKESAQSESTPVTGPSLLPPYDLTQSSDSCSVTVCWSHYNCPSVTSYIVHVHYYTDGSFNLPPQVNTCVDLYMLSPGIEHTITVESVLGTIHSGPSEPIIITTPPILPPYDLTQTPGDGIVTLCWSHYDCPTVTSYIVHINSIEGSIDLTHLENTCVNLDMLIPDVEYTITVESVSLLGNISSGPSEPIIIIGSSLQPPLLTEETPDIPGTVKVSWTNDTYPTVTEYVVNVSNNDGSKSYPIDAPLNKFITFFDLIPGQKYTVTVRSYSSDTISSGSSGPSKPLPITGPSLVAPVLAIAEADIPGTVKVSWTNDTYPIVNKYVVDVSNIDGSKSYPIENATFITFTDLIPGKTYNVTVRSLISDIPSGPSDSLPITGPSLVAPVLAIAEADIPGTVKVSWSVDDYPIVDWYNVFKENVFFDTPNHTNKFVIFNNLIPDRPYNITVISYNSAIPSGPSEPLPIKGPLPVPPVFINNSPTYADGKATVSWNNTDTRAVTKYVVDVSNIDGLKSYPIENATFITFIDLIPGKTYNVTVRSLISDISSGSSESLSVTGPSLVAPYTLTQSTETNGSVKVSWVVSTYPTVAWYNVYRNDYVTSYKSNITSTDISLVDLTPDQIYNIKIQSVSQYGNIYSGLSELIPVTGPLPVAPTVDPVPTYENGVATISWVNNDCRTVTSYDVFVGGLWNKNSTTITTTLSELVILQSYTVQVKSKIGAKTSDFSNTITVTMPLTSPPTLNINPVTTDVVTLYWSGYLYPENTQYIVCLDDVDQSPVQYTNFISPSLSPVLHKFKLRVKIGESYSSYSNEIEQTITYIHPPYNLTSIVSDVGSNIVNMNWDSYPASYNISKFIVKYLGNTTELNSSEHSFSFTNPGGYENEKTYVFSVIAVTNTNVQSVEAFTSITCSYKVERYVTNPDNLLYTPIGNCIILQNNAKCSDGYVSASDITCNIKLTLKGNFSTHYNILIIGGGAGGGSGTYIYSTAGGGGGGGGIIRLSNVPISPNETIDIQLGYAGQGRRMHNQDTGGCSGNGGGTSSVKIKDITYSSYGGSPGRGVGAIQTDGFDGGGGNGGSCNTEYGYGGGGGGGCRSSKNGPPAPGRGGSGSNGSNPGENGTNGTSSSGGRGGHSGIEIPVSTPVSLYLSGGGGGGGYGGGYAGKGQAGAQGSDTVSIVSGETALTGASNGNYYYGGGGGGGAFNYTYQYGGDGGKGAVIIWW